MRTRTKLCLATAAILLILFRIGISSRGQRYLIGTPSADHWQRDDRYMGAGLAPYVYCLAPCLILTIVGTVLLLADRRRPSTIT
jgi:hypothetical protein